MNLKVPFGLCALLAPFSLVQAEVKVSNFKPQDLVSHPVVLTPAGVESDAGSIAFVFSWPDTVEGALRPFPDDRK